MPKLSALLVLAAAAASLAACRSTPAARPVPLAAPPRLVAEGSPGGLDRAVDAARVVLVGESHDQRPHHELQRDVLERMTASGAPMLLGMEMFQRPVQRHLDDYVAGRIDETEMLRRTEYFTRWSFDHTLYAPLWRFARAHGARIVALNADGTIVRKIGRQGLGALTPEERAQVAREIDLHVPSHRERLRETFSGAGGGGVHGAADPRRLEFMYEAMTTWDETMAESAAEALAKAGPGARMLIVAGIGHIGHFDGIADRLARRVPGLRPLVIACRGEDEAFDDTPSWELAHFVVRMPDGAVENARLGVQFRGPSMVVEQVVAGGAGERLGLAPGDELLHAASGDGRLRALKDLTDLRIELDELQAEGGRGGLLVWRRADGTTASKALDLAPPAAPW